VANPEASPISAQPQTDAPVLAVILPALNEAEALPLLLPEIPDRIDHIILADNGSADDTANIAASLGADVVRVTKRGYGRACLAAVDHARALNAEIIIFMDADRSDYPEQMERLYQPIADGTADMVIGSRMLGKVQNHALTPQQYFGNRLACFLIRHIWGFRYTDLGPFRAIRTDCLTRLDMQQMTFGWTVEMQIKALQHRLRVTEAPVDYRVRIGRSKISGTVTGVLLAGYYILSTILSTALVDSWPFANQSRRRRSKNFGGKKNDARLSDHKS